MVISTDSAGPEASAPGSAKPVVLIIGAGVSGLLLAQHLKREGVSYRIFERDADLATRGAGWGLTLHWSLTALQSLLPSGLAERICDESSVDRWADRRGELSRFPFFDLDSGELKTQTPGAVKSARVRVTRQRLRKLLAEGIEIEVSRKSGVVAVVAVDVLHPSFPQCLCHPTFLMQVQIYASIGSTVLFSLFSLFLLPVFSTTRLLFNGLLHIFSFIPLRISADNLDSSGGKPSASSIPATAAQSASLLKMAPHAPGRCWSHAMEASRACVAPCSLTRQT